MATEPLARYIELKRQISALEKELDELKEQVFADVDSVGGEIDNEKFVIRSYKSPRYKFSEQYDKKNAEVKELRKKEIEEGIAVVDGYSEFVKLNFKKEKVGDQDKADGGTKKPEA